MGISEMVVNVGNVVVQYVDQVVCNVNEQSNSVNVFIVLSNVVTKNA